MCFGTGKWAMVWDHAHRFDTKPMVGGFNGGVAPPVPTGMRDHSCPGIRLSACGNMPPADRRVTVAEEVPTLSRR